MAPMPDQPGARWSRRRPPALLVVTVAIALGFAAGVPVAPHSPAQALLFDVVLLNAAPLVASVACLRAGRRVPEERLVWWGAAVASLLNVVGNLIYMLAYASRGVERFPSVADAFWLGAYSPLFLVTLALLRTRVARLRASTWLDGLVGALGVTAVAAAVFITPAVTAPHLNSLAMAANLAYPVVDLLLLALLGAVPAVLGARIDGMVVVLCLVLTSKLIGDVLVAAAQAGAGYEPGGPLDLTWMVNAALTAGAASAARPRRPARAAGEPLGWRALAVPLSCTVAALTVLGVQWGDGRLGLGEICAVACVLAFLIRTIVMFAELRSLQELRGQALTDHLTGLPNRRALAAEMDLLIRDGREAALMLLDLDGFKAVNDGLGHRAGDELLRRLGERLRPALRPEDLLFRVGGDEFAVLVPNVTVEAADECARRVHRLVCRPVELDGVPVQVGASLGVVLAPEEATTVDDLLHRADRAMYAAKATRGGVRWFSMVGEETAPAGDGASCGPHLLFRPRLSGGPGRVMSAVALVGHQNEDRDEWRAGDLRILEAACQAAAIWWPTAPVPVELSISVADLTTSRPADRAAAALLRANLPPAALVLRVEHAALNAAPNAVPALLAALRARNISTIVEAYGTGGPGCEMLHAGTRALPAEGLEQWLRQRDGSQPGIPVG